MSIAFLFTGQGSQEVGMGMDLAAACADCRKTLMSVDSALGFCLTDIMANGPEERIAQTMNSQPAIVAVSVAQARHLLALGYKPDLMAGHSVGVWSALVIAGGLEYHTGLRLAHKRGCMMQGLVAPAKGAMIAIVGLDHALVHEACREAGPDGSVDVACHNCPGQTVISGDRDAVEAAAALCEEKGGALVDITVSAPSHCRLMAPIAPAFRRLAEATEVQMPSIPVVDDTTGRPFESVTAIRDAMAAQIHSPVLFEESLQCLIASGADDFIQCGPGENLLNYAKRVSPRARLRTFQQALQSAA